MCGALGPRPEAVSGGRLERWPQAKSLKSAIALRKQWAFEACLIFPDLIRVKISTGETIMIRFSGSPRATPSLGSSFSRNDGVKRAARRREKEFMPRYYFDMKDGVPARDRSGLELVSDGAAIAHSKSLADKTRRDKPKGHPDLRVVVIDENGREVHRERIYPDAT